MGVSQKPMKVGEYGGISMKIAIAGTGYVGLSNAIFFNELDTFVIITNRLDEQLKTVRDKVYTRDIYFRD